MIEEIKSQVNSVLEQVEGSGLEPGDILVVGCSTSEVVGQRIGTASNLEVAQVLVTEVVSFCRSRQFEPVFQSCEHLNRALVLERNVARAHDLDEVTVIPHPDAGGAMATMAMEKFNDPVVVEHIAARGRAGIDIGNTLIGMHLRPVAVPLRIPTTRIGQASVVCANTRPKLIGGKRALYPEK